jgi:uncharacterized protein YgfB (UPF0149 family)
MMANPGEVEVVKLGIRKDEEAGVIRAFVMTMDETSSYEVSTLSLKLAEGDRQAFEEWKDALAGHLSRFLAGVGLKPDRIEERPAPPKDRN